MERFQSSQSDTLIINCQLSIINLLHSLLQGSGVELAEVDLLHAVLAGQEEGLGDIIGNRDDLAVLFRLREEISCVFGPGGIVQVKDPDDGLVPDGHIRTNGDVHKNLRFLCNE